ncbi:hypothetical protein CRG98_012306 [Punica granatum]|uniref:Uncharacterized protein n=1 Tax=Punica granatum TaxID=22663 RepID=A0A2I0KFL3_PUNGR|nr:hypothetical protein CRG98_012306 [Punica granatum]
MAHRGHRATLLSRAPTQDEWDFQATKEYILRFYRGSSSVHEDFTGSPQPEGSTPYGAPSISSMAVQAKLTSLRSEKDRLRWEVAEKDEQLIDQRRLQKELQRELAQARAETCCDWRPFIPTTHLARQASRANLRGQVTCGLHPSSMARRAVDRGPTRLPRRD